MSKDLEPGTEPSGVPSLLELLKLPAAIADHDLRIEDHNPGFAQFIQRKLDAGVPIADLLSLSEPDATRLTQAIRDLPCSSTELDIVDNQRNSRRLEILSNPLGGDRYLLIFVDVSRRWQEMSDQIDAQRKYLGSQKIEALGRLAGGVSHELNNHLAVVQLHIDILNLQLPDDNPIKNRISEIKEVTNSASAIVKKLLAYGRKSPMTSSPVVLNDILQSSAASVESFVGPDIEVQYDLDPNLGVCFVDPAQIVQVVTTLATSAKERIPGGGKLVFETSNLWVERDADNKLQKGQQFVQLSVSDNGPGMDERTIEHVFEPYYSTTGSDKGLGLGPALVYGVVKQLGGYIWVESNTETGTSFKLQFPRIEELEASGERPATVIQDPAPTNEPKILLVDDEEAVLNVTAEILGMSGFDVIKARSGKEALEIVEELDAEIDLLVTDFSMRPMNGAEVAAALREHYPDIRVLFISGDIEGAASEVGSTIENAQFLQKPYSHDVLTQTITEILKT